MANSTKVHHLGFCGHEKERPFFVDHFRRDFIYVPSFEEVSSLLPIVWGLDSERKYNY